jgi:DNA polymerase-1
VNPQSAPQLLKYAYETLKAPIQTDDEGKPTLDDAAVKTLIAMGYTDLHLLSEFKEVKRQLDFASIRISPRNTVHPLYLPGDKDEEEGRKGIAGTGRIQAKDPNVMQVPKPIRVMYVSHDPRNFLVEYDYDQAELRVMAALSGDVALQAALEGDVHQHHANLWGVTRDEAKTTVYAVMYGAGARKLQMTFTRRGTSTTQKECKALLDAFFETNPGVKIYREEIISRVQKDRQLRNPFGRHRNFWFPRRDVPAALDFMPQSTVADILWATIVPLAQTARSAGGRLLTIVHDSFLLELPEGTDVQPFREILTRPFNNIAPGFSLPVKWKIGSNWGTLKGAPNV